MYNKFDLANLLDKYSYHNIEAGKKVLLRACLNAPLNEKTGEILDATRIDAALPGIIQLAKECKRLIITAHLGRPEGADPKLSLRKIGQVIQQKSGLEVHFAEDFSQIGEAGVWLLENIRFFAEENSSDTVTQQTFAKKLAAYADVFVNDAFPDYRESPSTYYVAQLIPSFIGPSFLNEIQGLSKLADAKKPFVAVLGGKKLSEKVDTLKSLAEVADKVLVGGAMAYTLLQSQGVTTGNSLVEKDKLEVAKQIMQKFADKIVLPRDHVVLPELKEPAATSDLTFINNQNIPEGQIGVDIGVSTVQDFARIISEAQTILWAGPMGIFEWKLLETGTVQIGEAIANNSGAYKVSGGGDTTAAINKFNLVSKFDFLSTGGGATLAFLSYDKFPILDVILEQGR